MTEHDTPVPTLETLTKWRDDPDTAPDQDSLDQIVEHLVAARAAAREQARIDGQRVKALAVLLYRQGQTHQTHLAQRLQITKSTLSEALDDAGIPAVRVRGKRAEQAGITPGD